MRHFLLLTNKTINEDFFSITVNSLTITILLFHPILNHQKPLFREKKDNILEGVFERLSSNDDEHRMANYTYFRPAQKDRDFQNFFILLNYILVMFDCLNLSFNFFLGCNDGLLFSKGA